MEYIAINMRERKALGWDMVNQVTREAPVCDKRERITRILVSSKYSPCSLNGLCDLCPKKGGQKHYIEPPWFHPEDYEEDFLKF